MRIGLGIAFLIGVAAGSGANDAAPCVVAEAQCTEWIAFPGSSVRSMVYRSWPLTARNEQVERALIVVHGLGRNANDYFRTGVAAAFLAGALNDTVVIAPRFASHGGNCKDTLAEGEVSWGCSGDSWRSGARAMNAGELTSYDFMDELLRQLARRTAFPRLKQVVLVGHSAGGQYASRYAMANRVHDKLGIPITYVVSNPSSYAYPDRSRPTANGDQFGAFADGDNCTAYDRWPYGLSERKGYTAGMEEDVLRRQVAARPVVYLLGELDTTPRGGFDASCPAMAQGPNRLARGQSYAKLLNRNYGASHKVVVVGLCGHNARCMFTADEALKILFPAN